VVGELLTTAFGKDENRFSKPAKAGGSKKPGVERSGTPGEMTDKIRAHEVGGSGLDENRSCMICTG